MKKIIPAIFLFLFTCKAYCQSSFQKTIGSSGNNTFYKAVKSGDNYIMVGSTNSFGAGGKDILLVKTSFWGDTIWTRTFGGIKNEEAYSIKNTSDGNFIIVGYTTSFLHFGNDSSNIYILKIDTLGNLIWSKSLGGIINEVAKSVIETSDNNYLITGYADSSGTGCEKVFIAALSSSGVLLWLKWYHSSGCDYASDLVEMPDKSLLLTGITTSLASAGKAIFVFKTDSIGNFLWSKVYDFAGILYPKLFSANAIIKGNGNNYLITGSHGKNALGTNYPNLLNIDSSGTIIWYRQYPWGVGGETFSVEKATPNSLILGGRLSYFGFPNGCPAMINVNSSGQINWAYEYGVNWSNPPIDGTCFYSTQANDGSFISFGNLLGLTDTVALILKSKQNGSMACSNYTSTFSVGGGNFIVSPLSFTSSTYLVLSMDSCFIGNAQNLISSYCNINDVSDLQNENINCYPNPFLDFLTINTNSNNQSLLILSDIGGRNLLENIFHNKIIVSTSQLSKGIYIVKVISKSSTEIKLVIKQ